MNKAAEKLVADVQKGRIDELGRSIRCILAMTIVLEIGDIGRFATAAGVYGSVEGSVIKT